MIVERRTVVLGAVIAVPFSAVAWAIAPVLEYFRSQSPDGAFTVVARTQPYRNFVPMMPGQGSDKPARVTLYKGNQSCGSAWADMLSMAREMRWEPEGKPRRLEIKFVADWSLDDCALIRRWND